MTSKVHIQSRLREGNNILAIHARAVFSSATSSKSWFWRLRQLCLQYGLPHPATWLSTQPSKRKVKTMAKSAVLEYWLAFLRSQAEALPSLKYIQTHYLGLTKCHPLFRTCASSPWEVEKATTQARLLSGRYRLESLTGHWEPWNREGMCSLPDCWKTPAQHKGTVESFLLSCPSLSTIRLDMVDFTNCFLQENPGLAPLVNDCLALDAVQFWLDCSTLPPVIAAAQKSGDALLCPLFRLTRNYCHCLHKARMEFLKE